jgi:pimeloyl-ACP methyl ester carboxylesterase
MAESRTVARSAALRVLRPAFRALAWAAPPLAVRAAAALFRTPPRHETSDAERELLASGRRGRLKAAKNEIATWTWGKGPTILLVHGWGSRGARLGSFVEPLISAGYTVLTFDAPGHGESSGRLSSLPQFVAALVAVAETRDSIHGVIAHSMGGAATSLAMTRGLETGRAVFLAPVSNPAAYTRYFADVLGLPEQIRAGMEQLFERQFGFRWEEFDVRRGVSSLTTPLLVFHDREDREVAWTDGGESLARAWPGAELVTTRGLGHTRIVHDPDIVRRAVDFLVRQPQPREAELLA